MDCLVGGMCLRKVIKYYSCVPRKSITLVIVTLRTKLRDVQELNKYVEIWFKQKRRKTIIHYYLDLLIHP